MSGQGWLSAGAETEIREAAAGQIARVESLRKALLEADEAHRPEGHAMTIVFRSAP